MKEGSLLLLSDLQNLINQVVLIDYIIIILGGEKMRDLRSYYVFNIICGNAKEDDDDNEIDWYDCDGFGSYQ